MALQIVVVLFAVLNIDKSLYYYNYLNNTIVFKGMDTATSVCTTSNAVLHLLQLKQNNNKINTNITVNPK